MPKPLGYPVAAALLCAAAVFAATLDDVPFTTPVRDGPDYLGLQYLETLPTYSAVSNFVDALGYAGAISNEAALRIAGDAANSNHVAAVQAALLETNAAAAVQITGLYASNATVFASVGALELGTNAWNAAAALAATALQPSWAVTGTVANAQRLVSADGSLIWTEIENGTNWQYCVTNAVGVEGNRDRIVVVGFTHMDESNPYSGPSSNAVFTGSGVPVDGFFSYSHEQYSLFWNLPIEAGMRIWLAGAAAWRSETTNMPATLKEDFNTGTVTIDWYGPATNRTQIATQTGTAILISEHNESTDASIHPTLPRSNDVSNIVGEAVAAIPRVPTNAVTGWLMYDYGSNMWLRVSVSNWSFTVWEVVE